MLVLNTPKKATVPNKLDFDFPNVDVSLRVSQSALYSTDRLGNLPFD